MSKEKSLHQFAWTNWEESFISLCLPNTIQTGENYVEMNDNATCKKCLKIGQWDMPKFLAQIEKGVNTIRGA